MNAETVKQIEQSLAPLAQKIGQGATHLYEVYTRQVFAEGVAGLILTAIALVGCIILWGLGRHFYVKYTQEKKEEPHRREQPSEIPLLVSIIAAGFLSVILFMVVTVNLTDNITKIINPEYHALERILYQVKGD